MRSAFAGALVPCRDDRPAIWGQRTICPRRVPARRLGTVRRPHRLPIHLRRRQHLRAARERPGAERSPTRAPRRSAHPIGRVPCGCRSATTRPRRWVRVADPTAAPASRPRARPRCSWRPHSGRGVDDSHRAAGPCQHRMAHRPTAEPPSPARVLQRPAAGPTPPARPGPAQPDPGHHPFDPDIGVLLPTRPAARPAGPAPAARRLPGREPTRAGRRAPPAGPPHCPAKHAPPRAPRRWRPPPRSSAGIHRSVNRSPACSAWRCPSTASVPVPAGCGAAPAVTLRR